MEELIHNWIFNYGLVAIFFLMVSNGFISTPPSEIVLSLSGVISYLTGLNIFSIFFAALLANYLGAFIPYLIGRRVGYSWLLKLKIYFSGKNKFFNWIAKNIFPANLLYYYLPKSLKGMDLSGLVSFVVSQW